MKKLLTENELIEKAKYAINKELDFEEFKYCDEMYGYESQARDAWEYVQECKQIGEIAFFEKYKVTN